MKTPLRDRLGLVTPTCTHAVGEDDHPCRKPAVAIYYMDGLEMPRCRVHDRKVRSVAEENDIERRAVAA